MSLYDDALAAGRPQNLSRDVLQQVLSMRDTQEAVSNDYDIGYTQWSDPSKTYDAATNTHGYSLYRKHGWNQEGSGDAMTPRRDMSKDQEYITQIRPDTDGKLGDAWDLEGNYLGTYEAQDGGGKQFNQAALMFASTLGGNLYMQNAAGGGGSLSAVGNSVPTGMNPRELAAFLEANAGALAPGGEVAAGYGTTWGVGADGIIGSGATMTSLGQPLDLMGPPTPDPNQALTTAPPVTNNPQTGLPPASVTPGGNTVVPPVNNTTTPPVTNTTIPPVTNPLSGVNDWAQLMAVLSGLYGLKLADDAAEKSDPFGPYREGYAKKLQALEANPGLIKSTPGYFSGQDSINRSMASKGYLGSGNQAGALMRYGGDFYNQEANRLSTLAGANISPGNTYFNSADLASRSLAGIGYGLSPYMQPGGPR